MRKQSVLVLFVLFLFLKHFCFYLSKINDLTACNGSCSIQFNFNFNYCFNGCLRNNTSSFCHTHNNGFKHRNKHHINICCIKSGCKYLNENNSYRIIIEIWCLNFFISQIRVILKSFAYLLPVSKKRLMFKVLST